jgi:hypothetical protein
LESPFARIHQQSRVSTPRSALARELSRVEEQVAKDPERIARQRAVVSNHKQEGLDSAIARAVLEQLETLQRVHIADRDRLLGQPPTCRTVAEAPSQDSRAVAVERIRAPKTRMSRE